MKPCVYKITNHSNKRIYIGETLDIDRRWQEHLNELRNKTHHSIKLQNDYNIYGEDVFTLEIIKDLNNYIHLNHNTIKLLLIIYESEYINKYKSIEYGYNYEDTLKEVLQGNKSVHSSKQPNKKEIMTLRNIMKNLKENNNEFIPKYQPKEKLNKEKIIKIVKPKPHIDITNMEYISFKNCINYIEGNGYKLLCGYNNICKKFRELQIFYYAYSNNNLPSQYYIDQGYFIVYFNDDKTFDKMCVSTSSGIEFVKNTLLEHNLINKI